MSTVPTLAAAASQKVLSLMNDDVKEHLISRMLDIVSSNRNDPLARRIKDSLRDTAKYVRFITFCEGVERTFFVRSSIAQRGYFDQPISQRPRFGYMLARLYCIVKHCRRIDVSIDTEISILSDTQSSERDRISCMRKIYHIYAMVEAAAAGDTQQYDALYKVYYNYVPSCPDPRMLDDLVNAMRSYFTRDIILLERLPLFLIVDTERTERIWN